MRDVTTRRRFLLVTGSGLAGVGLGVGSTVTRAGMAGAAPATRSERRLRERQGAAHAEPEPARLGTHRVIWSTTTSRPLAALTFDDGPTPEYTTRVLAALSAAGVTATFNVMGHNAVTHSELLREMAAAGHEIGNHTWTHRDLTDLTPAETRTQIVRCRDEVEHLLQRPLAGFRPPRGELTGYALRVCAELGYDVWMWSCSRGPRGVSTPEAVADHVASVTDAGAVVDLHDGLGVGTFHPGASFARVLADRREVEVRALPTILRRIADRGITLTTVTGLLAASAPEPIGGSAGTGR